MHRKNFSNTNYDFMIVLFCFLKIMREMFIYELWQAAGGISLWLNDEILFWDLPLPSIYFYNLKKKERGKGGGCSCLPAQHSSFKEESEIQARQKRTLWFLQQITVWSIWCELCTFRYWRVTALLLWIPEPGIVGEISLSTFSSEPAFPCGPSHVFSPLCFIPYRIHATSNRH